MEQIFFYVGNAGRIDPMVEIGDTVISTEIAYFDVDANILTGYHSYLESMALRQILNCWNYQEKL